MRLQRPGVFIDAELASKMAPVLEENERRMRRDGHRLRPEVKAGFDELCAEGRRWQELVAALDRSRAADRVGTSEYRPSTGSGGAGMVEGVELSAAEVAERWECTARNVTALAGRGGIAGRKAGGSWRFRLEDVQAVEARREIG